MFDISTAIGVRLISVLVCCRNISIDNVPCTWILWKCQKMWLNLNKYNASFQNRNCKRTINNYDFFCISIATKIFCLFSFLWISIFVKYLINIHKIFFIVGIISAIQIFFTKIGYLHQKTIICLLFYSNLFFFLHFLIRYVFRFVNTFLNLSNHIKLWWIQWQAGDWNFKETKLLVQNTKTWKIDLLFLLKKTI